MPNIVPTSAEDIRRTYKESAIQAEILLVIESIAHLHRHGMEGTNTMRHLERRLRLLHEALLPTH